MCFNWRHEQGRLLGMGTESAAAFFDEKLHKSLKKTWMTDKVCYKLTKIRDIFFLLNCNIVHLKDCTLDPLFQFVNNLFNAFWLNFHFIYVVLDINWWFNVIYKPLILWINWFWKWRQHLIFSPRRTTSSETNILTNLLCICSAWGKSYQRCMWGNSGTHSLFIIW